MNASTSGRFWIRATGSTAHTTTCLFEIRASAEAQQQVDTLTAGTGAGDAFDTIVPDQTAASLTTKVLFDQKDQPFSVVAIVHFKATGSGKDGQDLQMNSQGQFVFQQVDGAEGRLVPRAAQRHPRKTPTATATATSDGSRRGCASAALAVTALVAWVAGSALGTLGAIAPASAQAGVVIGKAHAGYAPSLTGTKPIVLLVIGSGARLGDDVQHSLADSIHVVSINPDKHKATIIGILATRGSRSPDMAPARSTRRSCTADPLCWCKRSRASRA